MNPNPTSPSVLLIGAGQVAVVFAHHLARGGARAGFLVRPAYEAATRKGFKLYPLNRPRAERYTPVDFAPDSFSVLTDAKQAKEQHWDYVLLTQPSSGLRGAWFDELVAACPAAFFVTFQLGLGDREWIGERLADQRIMAGMLALVSYAAPLADEPVPVAGTAYWFPPGAPIPIQGRDAAALGRLVKALGAGGLHARGTVIPPGASPGSGARGSRLPDFALMALVTALELCDWKFAALQSNRDRVRLAILAAEEASAVDDRRLGTRRPLAYSIITPASMRFLLAISRRLLPLPLEAFLRVHFTKVGAQVVRDRRLHIAEAQRLGLPCAAMERLDQALSR